jgi:AhpD family alkylhydroperoxidase
MVRIPLLPEDLSEPKDIVDAAKARRANGKLARIDRLLLYSPPVSFGWNTHSAAIRTKTQVPARLRELVTIAVSHLTRHQYEVDTHKPFFLKAGGSQQQFDALYDVDRASSNADLFDEQERAALALAIEMCRAVDVTDATFARVQAAMGDHRSLVELVAIIATYNMTNRFQRAFDFG